MRPRELHSTANPPHLREGFVMANVLSRADQLQILNMLVEGCSLRSITRLTRVHRATTAKLMMHVGTQCRTFLDSRMRNLKLSHCELDEIWTFVLKKQAHLNSAESSNQIIGDQYLYVAIDEDTKLIPSFVIGKRNKEVTEMFCDDLASRLDLPELHHAEPKPLLSTDGWNAYPNAIDGAFAGRANYGTIIKDFTEATQPGRYGPPKMSGASRKRIIGSFDRDEICTSHVERHNLSIRTFLRRFTRLALGFSKKLECLAASVSLYVAHYNFCRLHGSLPGTPAMAARLTGHPWTMDELLTKADGE